MRIQRRFPQPRHKGEQGYILLTLTLFVALLVIAAAAVAPTLTFQIQRDREEEMIHRGTQYSRAIRNYFKKFGRYPTSLNDLENTNNLRFLRKRYKDPITGKDFKLLHFGEVQMMSMGGGIAGATPVSALGGTGTAGTGSVSASGFSLGATGTQTSNAHTQPGAGNAGTESASNDSPSDQSGPGSDQASGQIIGGPIVGVISASKAKSIREFGGKDHYNQWQFIYDPGTDRGGLINTPAQPPLQGVANNTQVQPGTQGFGSPASAFGSSTPSGSSANGSQQPPAQTPSQTPVSTPTMPPDQ